MLTALSLFWFEKLAHVIPNHLTGIAPETVVAASERDQVAGRAMVVRRLKPLLIEAIARGYIIGSGWKDYQKTGAVCGIPLPGGLAEAEQLPQPIFTPSTKAAIGKHDENISFAEAEQLIGAERARAVRDATLALYTEAAEHARSRGIIIADTKFEFGVDERRDVVSHRRSTDARLVAFLARISIPRRREPADRSTSSSCATGSKRNSWNKQPPAPALPPDVLARTAEKYTEALRLLTGAAPLQ